MLGQAAQPSLDAMKPARFSYIRPNSTQEAIDALARHRGAAKILAGGQSLIPILNFRLSRFDFLIDINGLRELSFIRREGDRLRIGALTRYRQLETSELIAAHAPLVQRATKYIGHLPIRTRGTIGGSLAHADPAAEMPAVLLALGGSVIAKSASGERSIPAAEFLCGLFTTALQPDELLTEIRIPDRRPGELFGIAEHAQRPGDLAIAGVAGYLQPVDGGVRSARLVAFGLGGSPQRMTHAEEELISRPLDVQAIERAKRAAAKVATQSDLRATAAARTHFLQILTERVLQEAIDHREENP